MNVPIPGGAAGGPEKDPPGSRAADAAADAALLARIAGGDRAAFADLFGRYAGRVKSFLIAGGAAPDQADEVAQEVMVTVWRRAALYDPAKAAPSTWIFTIARNRRIDMIRRARRPAPDPEDPLFQPEAEPDPEESAAASARDARVREALSELSEDQRETVRLAFFAGLTQTEIAEQIGAPLGTVKSRLRLAFRKLRDALGDEFSEELRDD
ncbi:sigma-70 family RNA polymerase sigma factor [Rhodovulum sp. DZ06]|uniref:sigma-70 family RNA polymerase sigma factor n=1 Tax=Rhodovulum sp. DZ06 TaxID=3425126 RepID=UPI003D3279E8